MKQCAESGKIPATLGIDTWAVDFVLLDRAGERLCDAVAYRDGRTEGMAQLLEQKLPFAELYGETGIQKQPFNTIYQLLALKREFADLLEHAESFLMLPDYFHFLLTGEKLQEYIKRDHHLARQRTDGPVERSAPGARCAARPPVRSALHARNAGGDAACAGCGAGGLQLPRRPACDARYGERVSRRRGR